MVKKFNKVKDELLDHDYDGIQELDNELPPWWLYLFYFTIVFAIVYMIHYHVLGTGPSSEEEYMAEMSQAAAMYQKAPQEQEAATAPIAAFTDAANLEAGKAVFMKNCIPCHGQNGEGIVGPNLTDEYWLHGARMQDIVKTITNGVPAKGMIPWGPILKKEEILQVASYVITLRGTNPPNPKAPEGEKVDYSQLEQ